MIGLGLTLGGSDGGSQKYLADLQSAKVAWSGDALPTCELVLDNQTGRYASLPLFSAVALTLPNSLGTFNFSTEEQAYSYRAQGGLGTGRTVTVRATAAPEFIFLTEGNLDVVGTDLPVGQFNARGTLYIPYVSTFVAALGTPLMEVGGILNALLHTVQPSQGAGFRGRLGYDCTGQGVPTSGIDYVGGPVGVYVKGMWQVGLGSTGAQRTGLDLVREVLTKNLIDGAGNQAFMDWYVDPTVTPPQLKAFVRGSVSSTATVAVGVDAVQDLELPVDTRDVRNFVVYWANAESLYPNGGDSWSNYDTSAHMQGQWALTVNVGAATEGADPTVNRYGFGSSNFYLNSNPAANAQIQSKFSLGPNGYAVVNKLANRNVAAIAFSLQRAYIGPGDLVRVTLYDDTGANVIQTSSIPLTAASAGGGWQDLSVLYPASGTGNQGVWTVQVGSWNFASTPIGAVEIFAVLGNNGAQQQQFWLDYVQIADNWGFSPVYSYNLQGPTATTLTQPAFGGGTVLHVGSTTGFIGGMYAVVGATGVGQEVLRISSVGGQVITLAAPLSNTHATGQFVVAATHDPNSVTAYGNRIFNFTDFYVTAGQSDAAPSIADGILQSRKGKKSTGTLKLSGYAPQVPLITPRSLFSIADPKDVYSGGTADSTITSWVADTIEYSLVPEATEGFTATYTVEPFFGSVGTSSPDTNRRNLWRQTDAAGYVARLNRASQYFGGPR